MNKLAAWQGPAWCQCMDKLEDVHGKKIEVQKQKARLEDHLSQEKIGPKKDEAVLNQEMQEAI